MKVFNPSNQRVTFRILPSGPPEGTPNWRRKKLVRAGIHNVAVEPKANCDLSQYGVTSPVGHPELQILLKKGHLSEIKTPAPTVHLVETEEKPCVKEDAIEAKEAAEFEALKAQVETLPTLYPAGYAFTEPFTGPLLDAPEVPEEGEEERSGLGMLDEEPEGQEEAPTAQETPVVDVPAPAPTPVMAEAEPEATSGTTCPACEFEAANPRGLKRHQASCRPFQATQGLDSAHGSWARTIGAS